MKIFPNMPQRQLRILISLFLSIAILTVYWQVHGFSYVSFDDPLYVTENEHVQKGISHDSLIWAFSPFKTDTQTYWHPLTWLSHMLDCQLFGVNPGAHHLVNLLLHVINATLLFLALHYMTRSLWKSAFVAALFALHPINVDSVAWIAERKNLLSTLFWMLTMLAYIRYARKPALFRYVIVFGALAFGLLAKPMLVTLPCALLLLDFWPLGRMNLGQTFTGRQPGDAPMFKPSGLAWLIMEKLPLLLLSIAAIALSVLSLQIRNQITDTASAPVYLRIENALVSYTAYLWKMIWPVNLAVFYPFPKTVTAWQPAIAAVFLVALTSLAVIHYRKSPWFLTGWLWYLGSLLPVSGLVQGGTWPALADRWAYIPFIGIFIIISWGVPELIPHHRLKPKVLAVASVFLLIILSAATWRQTSYWHNSQTLFEHALEVTSGNYLAHNNLGSYLQKQKQFDEAERHYLKAIEIKPDNYLSYCNLGDTFNAMGRNDEAIRNYLESLRIAPLYTRAHEKLADALNAEGRYREAENHYREAIILQPDNPKTHNNLAALYLGQGKLDAAAFHSRQALRILPDYADAHFNLGNALYKKGRIDDAIRHFLKALELNQHLAEARINLADAYFRQGKLDDAIGQYQKALAQKPDSAEAHANLANTLRMKGQTDQAIHHYLEAIKINPMLPEIRNNLGVTFIFKGDIHRAIACFKDALMIKPDYQSAKNNLGKALLMQHPPR
ncbi:MAG: tetratricopeptide repeat protein [Desulfobacteraceae bacterium]|nr:tetratricopeptide repeat protein [Desulfobacteraceae bacterium]